MQVKWVLRYDPSWPKFRLLRIMWGRVDGLEGVSSKLSFALRPKLLTRVKSFASWRYTVLGLEVHFARSYGGNFC